MLPALGFFRPSSFIIIIFSVFKKFFLFSYSFFSRLSILSGRRRLVWRQRCLTSQLKFYYKYKIVLERYCDATIRIPTFFSYYSNKFHLSLNKSEIYIFVCYCIVLGWKNRIRPISSHEREGRGIRELVIRPLWLRSPRKRTYRQTSICPENKTVVCCSCVFSCGHYSEKALESHSVLVPALRPPPRISLEQRRMIFFFIIIILKKKVELEHRGSKVVRARRPWKF